MEGNAENGGGRRGSRLRIAVWSVAALILLWPLVAMQFSDDVIWSMADFVFAGILLFGTLGTYELAARKTGNTAYRAGVGVALAAVFLLVWVIGAVGIIADSGDRADLMYFGVLAVGVIGAAIARFQPHGMARALLAMALAQALVAVVALIAGIVPAYNSAFEILGINGIFVALFVGSALLFREAAHGRSELGVV